MLNEFKKIFQKPFTFDNQHVIHNGISLDIQVGTLDNLEALLELQETIYSDYRPWSPQNYMFELTRRNSTYLLVMADERLIGVLGIAKKSKKEAHISNIGIHPDYQNKNIGHYLLNLSFAMAKENGFTKLTLEVDSENIRAIKLYKSLGFYEVKQKSDYYDNGHDGLELCKQINQ